MRIVVAMSGGVDSSVAAALLAEQGHDVIGLSMQLYDQREGQASFGSCCTIDDLHDARRVAAAIDIPHYILNFERQFDEQVVSNFVSEYAAGRTPLPCAHCNSDLKFATLVERARGFGADAVATGHYARVERDPATGRYLPQARRRPGEGPVVLPLLADAGAARARGLPRRRSRPRTPCASTRARAGCRSRTSPTARRSASSRTTTTRRSSRAACPRPSAPGVIVDEGGRVLGRHDGIHRFTVGQRKGLGLSRAGAALRARAAARPSSRSSSGPKAALEQTRLTASGVNWMVGTAGRAAARRRRRSATGTGPRRPRSAPLDDGPRRSGVRRAADRDHARPGGRLLRRRRVVGGGWID